MNTYERAGRLARAKHLAERVNLAGIDLDQLHRTENKKQDHWRAIEGHINAIIRDSRELRDVLEPIDDGVTR